MKIAAAADVKANLGTYLDHVESEGPVVITRDGKAVAVLIAPDDEDELERLVLANSPKFLAMLQKSYDSIQAGKGIPAGQFWKQVRNRAKEREKSAGRPQRRTKRARS